ncbi:MAG: hypothetical protein AAF593_10640, partial [Planctomycetota bacterium]
MPSASPTTSEPLPVLTAETTQRLTARWFALLAVLMAGLAIGGRGFAYIGLPPLFISEIMLALGAMTFLIQ